MTTKLLPLACFGKLPFYREYLEEGAIHPTSRALKAWLHQGKEALGLEHVEQGVRDIAFQARLRLLLGFPGSKELLIGVLRPSRDAGGRHYPFAVFAFVPRKIYRRHYALLPTALAPVWEALDDAWTAFFSVATRDEFEELLRSQEVPHPVTAAEARGDYQGRQREGAARLFENRGGASLERLMGNMPDVLGRLRGGGGGGVSLELPVARDLDEACFNASFWIDIVNRQFRLRRFEPSVLLDERAGVEDRNVFLKFGALEPRDYLDLTGEKGETPLLRPARAPEATGEAVPPPAGDPSYADLLALRF